MTDTNSRPELPASDSTFCPHLGIEEDPETCLGYPSLWNFCHHARPIAVVSMSHQREMCLSAAHTACPVFLGGQAAPLPAELRGHARAKHPASKGS